MVDGCTRTLVRRVGVVQRRGDQPIDDDKACLLTQDTKKRAVVSKL